MKSIRLREGRERSLLRRHPWIFDSAVARGGADAGETVRVEAHDGAFFRQRLAAAVALRARLQVPSDGVRLVHGESDGLPGFVVDRYGDTLVAQFLSAGAERWKKVLADALLEATGLARLYERSDANSRGLEGLPEATGWLRGDGPTEVVVTEHAWKFGLDIATGHKTGFYLDQRDSRARFAQWVRRF
ncbi:MAG: hypothetical protein K0S48_792, partial [Ramlibacter sp.]|nr:hypothetical protein [Ramlibacter sp.]